MCIHVEGMAVDVEHSHKIRLVTDELKFGKMTSDMKMHTQRWYIIELLRTEKKLLSTDIYLRQHNVYEN